MTDFADQLLAEIQASDTWPLQRDTQPRTIVARRRALRVSDKPTLKAMAGWNQWPAGLRAREYVVDPLPRTIARAFADFLFGQSPECTAAAEGDQPWLDAIVDGNDLDSELHRAERICVSEGEVWWKVYVDRDCELVPIIGFSSRLGVVPLWRGRRLLACAFHSRVNVAKDPNHSGEKVVYRHLELHADLVVRHFLFRGSDSTLGALVPLGARAETADLPEEWVHGLPMLAGRIVNDFDDDPTLGEGDYDQVQDLLLGLNEARTIGAENTRLTAKQRIGVAGELLEPDGSFDAGMDVIRVSPDAAAFGEGGSPPIVQLERSYDALPLIAHNTDLVKTILSRVGLVPQFVGQDVDGQAESGTAVRLRFLPTVNAAHGKAKEWDDRLPDILHLAMQVDALPEEAGGFGREYAALGEEPAVERGEVIPADEAEDVKTHVTAVTGEIESRRTAIEAMHPDWDEKRVQQELDDIRADSGSLAPMLTDSQPPPVVADPSSPPIGA